jgi:hypothetical protein
MDKNRVDYLFLVSCCAFANIRGRAVPKHSCILSCINKTGIAGVYSNDLYRFVPPCTHKDYSLGIEFCCHHALLVSLGVCRKCVFFLNGYRPDDRLVLFVKFGNDLMAS